MIMDNLTLHGRKAQCLCTKFRDCRYPTKTVNAKIVLFILRGNYGYQYLYFIDYQHFNTFQIVATSVPAITCRFTFDDISIRVIQERKKKFTHL